jgi:non-canonical (house-cleaning) NTP pyrophosphatase
MKLTICGSMQFDPEMQAAKKQLEKYGYEVDKPNVVEGHVYEDNLDENVKLKRGFIDEHFRKIDGSDAVVVVNHAKNGVDNYIGGNTLIEIAYTYAQGLEIFLLNPIPKLSYADEVRAMQPIILDGDIAKIDDYFQKLPLLMMSTESPVKHRAVSRALRRAGIRVRVDGMKVESGVNEQPKSIEESYEGAINRHKNLKKSEPKADYLATIESGLHTVHKNHNAFGCAVAILEKVGQEQKIGIDLDLEFPREITDKVPSEYPDVGVLVQQKYGSKLKDPYPFFTNNKITRAKLLENAFYNLAVQLDISSVPTR